MKLRIGFVVASTLLLLLVLSTPFAFAQRWDAVLVNAQYTDLVIDEINGSFSFTVTLPDPGTANSITATSFFTGDNLIENLSPGDRVVVSYTGFAATDVVNSTATGYLSYRDPADSVTINAAEIPEFPSWTVILVALTLVAIASLVYKKKLKV